MAAWSARCVRSLARASIQISKTALSTNGVSQTRCISSAVGKSILRDCGLLKTIARDNITRNLARRHTRLSAAVNLLEAMPYQWHTWVAKVKWCPGIQDTISLSAAHSSPSNRGLYGDLKPVSDGGKL